jgi:hypothetical protein
MDPAHLSVLGASTVREVGGLHGEFAGTHEHDLVLRVTERARRVIQLPEVLYHRMDVADGGSAQPQTWESGRRAVQAHLDRVGIHATAELGARPGPVPRAARAVVPPGQPDRPHTR